MGPKYVIFVSTFNTIRLTTGATWKIPSLDALIESLIHEQDKIIKNGTLRNSKSYARTMPDSGNTNYKSKQKGRGEKDPNPRKGGKSKPYEKYSNLKVGKGKKGKSK